MIKAIIVDDEQISLTVLNRMISRNPNVHILGLFKSTKDAETFIQDNDVDVIILDISMPEETGLEFIKRISETVKDIKVIYITSYKEYALDAFEVYAFDYLVKPISKERLFNTIDRIISMKEKNNYNKTDKTFQLYVYCLGGIDIRDNNKNPVRFPSSKSEELFVYLLSNRGKTVSKWKVIEDVFSGMTVEKAEVYLNTTIYNLRKVLHRYNLKEIIKVINKTYSMDISKIYIDFFHFEEKVAKARVEQVQKEVAMEIERIYTGELFGSKIYDWAIIIREEMLILYWNFTLRLITELMLWNEYGKALEILRKLENIIPLDEDVNCLIIQCYAGNNQKIDLMKHYKKYKQLLLCELGSIPRGKIDSLYEELLATI